MPPVTVTSFKHPPWNTYERAESRESSPRSSPASSPRSSPVPPRATAPETAPVTSPPETFGGVRFSTDILDLSSQDAMDSAPGLAKLQRALSLGDGRVAGLWVKLPNGVRTPMIVRRHGRHAIELALLYEKRSHGDTSAVDRAELVKRLKSVLTAETKGVFKTYSQITEVWKAAQENAEACHQRLADQLHWHASAGRTLREGLADEKELRDIVADPAWQRMQAKRAKRSSLGFTLPHDADAVSSPRRARDDMTKVIAAKFEDTPSEDARRTAPKASPDAGTAPWPPAAAWTRRGPLRPSPANRTVLLDIMPQTKF